MDMVEQGQAIEAQGSEGLEEVTLVKAWSSQRRSLPRWADCTFRDNAKASAQGDLRDLKAKGS